MKTSKVAVMLGFALAGIGSNGLASELLLDYCFNDSGGSVGLRTNSAGQDWYESRQDVSSLLTLDNAPVGRNATPKARLLASTTGNAYLTQEFNHSQARAFSVQWDIYVDSIVDSNYPDRAGWMLIGDDSGTDPERIGPNAEDEERFVYMAFYKEGGGETGQMDLVAREQDSPWHPFTTVATDLRLKQWYTIRVYIDLVSDTYDVYINGQFKKTLAARTAKDRLSHISFAQWHDGPGTFYVDNVVEGFAAEPAVTNKIVREWWLGIPGTDVTDLMWHADYPDNPSGRELLNTFESPVDWTDNYGTRMYGWLKPPISGVYTFWISGDDQQILLLSQDGEPANAVQIARVTDWTAFREWDKFAGQSGTLVWLEAGRKYYIEALGKEGLGGDSTAVAWQPPDGELMAIPGEYVDAFSESPLPSFSPKPADDGVLDAVRTPQLEWSSGQRAQWHDVYFGSERAAVANATRADRLIYRGRQTRDDTSYALPDGLGWDETYYWRVDEVESEETIRRGDVWRFTTADFVLVDDFESYDNDRKVISLDWVGNREAVSIGYALAPYAEQTVVHVGRQSMPIFYDQAIASPAEASRRFASADDWTVKGVNTLSLWYRGYPENIRADMYVVIQDDLRRSAPFANPDPDAVLRTEWTKWNIPLSYFRNHDVDLSMVRTISIGIGDSSERFTPEPQSRSITALSDDDQRVDIDSITLMEGPTWLKGDVRDALTGEPIIDANVVFTKEFSNTRSRSTPSDESAFKICLGDGTYRISVEADGYEKSDLAYDTAGMGYVTKRDVLLTPQSAPELSLPVFRFRSPVGSWYFSADPSIRDDLLYEETEIPNSKDWRYDGIAFCGSGAGEPVYMLFCRQGEFTSHLSYPFYTMDKNKTSELLSGPDAYLYEDRGMAFFAYAESQSFASCKPVYRFKAENGYFYTISEKENLTWSDHTDWEGPDLVWHAFDYVNVDVLRASATP